MADARAAVEMAGRDLARKVGDLIVRTRFLIVIAWLILTGLATLTLPTVRPSGGAGLRGLVPEDSVAVRTEIRDVQTFGFPLISRTIVVQHDPAGLSALAQSRTVLRAINLDRGLYPGLEDIAGALPITNAFGLVAPSNRAGDTALTLLFFRPDVSIGEREQLAQRFVAEHFDPTLDAPVGITGAVPGRLAQGRLLRQRLPLVEVLTVLLILIIVGAHFRAPGAALLALTAAGIAYLLSLRLIAWALRAAGLGLPEELEPLIVVLLLGIVTDYSIFFLDHTREALRSGKSAAGAVAGAVAEIGPIVATAGLAVALGTSALFVARLDTFRALGPGMGITVLIGVAVSITFVPAVIAAAGRLVFWPTLNGRLDGAASDRRLLRRRRMMRRITGRRAAIAISLVGILVLGALTAAMLAIHLGFSIVGALPPDSPPRLAASAAADGFAPGIISPTTLLIEARDGRPLSLAALTRLQQAIEHRPDVAGVIGPGDFGTLAGLFAQLPPSAVSELPESPERLVLRAVVTPERSAARMLIVLDQPPLGGPAVKTFRDLQADADGLARDAGLDPGSVRIGFAGDTALAAETIDQTVSDLRRIVVAVGLLMLVLLAAFLRSLVAPLFLVATSLLAFLAALGITAIVSRMFGVASVSFFVPFASAVLLISLGSDYNIFLVGRVWRTARTHPLTDAIVDAAPKATSSIAVAGVTLAGSFAVLAIVPLRPMQQFALAMVAGILLDTFVVRALIVPAMLAAVGPLSGWPGPVWSRRLRSPERAADPSLDKVEHG